MCNNDFVCIRNVVQNSNPPAKRKRFPFIRAVNKILPGTYEFDIPIENNVTLTANMCVIPRSVEWITNTKIEKHPSNGYNEITRHIANVCFHLASPKATNNISYTPCWGRKQRKCLHSVRSGQLATDKQTGRVIIRPLHDYSFKQTPKIHQYWNEKNGKVEGFSNTTQVRYHQRRFNNPAQTPDWVFKCKINGDRITLVTKEITTWKDEMFVAALSLLQEVSLKYLLVVAITLTHYCHTGPR